MPCSQLKVAGPLLQEIARISSILAKVKTLYDERNSIITRYHQRYTELCAQLGDAVGASLKDVGSKLTQPRIDEFIAAVHAKEEIMVRTVAVSSVRHRLPP